MNQTRDWSQIQSPSRIGISRDRIRLVSAEVELDWGEEFYPRTVWSICTTINREREHNIKPLQINTQNCPAQTLSTF